MPLYAIPNLSSSQATMVEPWTNNNHAPPAGMSKGDFSKWAVNPATNGVFVSAFEGLNPHIRVSERNRPWKQHGLIGDYDVTLSEEELRNGLIEHSKAGLRPSYAHRTYSGRGRVIWLFEQPLLLPEKLIDPFLKLLRKELGAAKLFGGLDENILEPSQYYHWLPPTIEFSPERVPTTLLHFLLGKACDTKRYTGEGDMEIPLDRVHEEIANKYPNRWGGPFEAGARGVCFWSPGSDNPTAAIVTPTGMVAFSQEKPFYSWADLLGFDFVKRFEQDKFGKPLRDFYFDGHYYWSKDANNIWRSNTKDDTRQDIIDTYEFSGCPATKGILSEADRTLHKIRETRRIDKAFPVLFSDKETSRLGAELVLNISRVKPVTFVDQPVAWGEGFPWLAEFLDHFLDDDKNAKPHLYSWIHRLYKSAVDNNLTQGHAIFIAGGVGRGKSLFSNVIIGGLMGGIADASDFLLGNSNWNAELLHVPIWIVDDAKSTTNYQKHQMWTAMIKKSVSNTRHPYNVKYRDTATVDWKGRIICSLNDDPESIRQIPHTDGSILDKIMLFQATDAKPDFPPNSVLEATIRSELPYFARWVLDYQIPEEIHGGNRFGIKSYHHPVLLEETRAMSQTQSFREVIDSWRHEYKRHHQLQTVWVGSATQLLQELMATESIKELVRPLCNQQSQDSLGRKLAALAQPGSDCFVHRTQRTSLCRKWAVDLPEKGVIECDTFLNEPVT